MDSVQRQEWLHSLLETAPIGIAVASGPDNRLEMVNRVYRAIIGLPEGAAAGRTLREVFPEATAQAAEGYVEQARRSGRTVNVREIAAPTGEPPRQTYWDVDYVPLPPADGAAGSVLMLAVPVTEKVERRQQAEALAGEAEERAAQLQAVLAAISDIVLVYDERGNLAFINDAAARQVGIEATPEAMERLSAQLQSMELYWPDGRPVMDGERQRPRALAGEVITGEELMYRPVGGGPLRWVRASAAPVRGREGQITGAVVTAADITIQKEAQAERERLLAEVQAARENLRVILDRLPDGVMVVDAAQRVVMDNETTRRYVGHDVTGMTLLELRRVHEFVMVDGRPFAPGQTPVERALRGEPVTGVEARILQLNGRIVDVLESTAPLYDAEGRLSGAVVALTDITAQQQAQAERERLLAEVQGAQEKLYTVIDRLPDWVLVLDADLRVTLSNEAIRRDAGRELVGMNAVDLWQTYQFLAADGRPFPPGDSPAERALRGEPVANVEMRIRRPDGTTAYGLESVAPLYAPDGALYGVVVVLTDITGRKQAEAERERLLKDVQAARQNLQTLLEGLPTGVLVVDETLRITLANGVAQQYMGPGLVGRTISEVVRGFRYETPEGRLVPEDEMPLQRALRGEVVMGMEMLAHVPGAGVVDTLSNAVPRRDAEGRIAGATLVVTDITPQREALAERDRLLVEVEGARSELRTIIDQLPDAVIVADRSGRVTLTNRVGRRYAGRDIVGMTLPELHGYLDFRRPDGERFPEGEAPLERALRGEIVANVEGSIRLADGQRYDVLKSAVPVLAPDGAAREAAAVLVDITGLKELDRAKDQFISVAAHELRTPLTALKGHAQILLRRAERAGWQEGDRRSLRTIDGQVDHLNDLIGRLLDVSRIRLGRLQLKREPTDIVALAHKVAEDMQVTTEAHRITVEAALPHITGNWDPAALRQVLTNLIGNAIKYAPGGPIEVRVWQDGGQALLSVTDRGPGIPPERQAQLFEAFRPGGAREYRQAGGLGLGLYISRGIIQAHGGRIWVESQPGVGSTFTCSLPLNGRR